MASHRSHPLNQARRATIRIADFDCLSQLFSSWQGSFEQLSCGRFEGTLQIVHGQLLKAHQGTGNKAIRVCGREEPGVHTLALVLPDSAGCIWQGRRLESGRLVVRSGDVEIDHLTSRQATNLSVIISDDVLRHATRAFNRTDLGSVSWLAAHPQPDLFQKLQSLIHQFLTGTMSSSSSPLEANQLEQACLAAAVEAMVPVTDILSPDLPARTRSMVVRRAEELMRAYLRLPLGEIDLCTELGVSGRTLRLAFHERFGLGPMTYYQTLRLNAARAALKASDPELMSVSLIAQDFGFYHPGKFSGYYRRLFGELPSDHHF